MSGPNFTGAAVFAGIGQGVDKAVDNLLKLKQMQEMDNYHRFRLALQGVNDFYARGGHLKPLNNEDDEVSGRSAPEAEAHQRTSLQNTYGTAQQPAATEPPAEVAAQGVMRLGE